MAASKIKYMGTADVRRIEKGDTFAGRLPDGLPSELKFNEENHWVVEVDDDDVKELLLSEPDFKDVSDLKRVPANENQKTFRGISGAEKVEEASEDAETDGEPKQVKAQANPSGSETGAKATAVGGSTGGSGKKAS